MGKYRGKKYDPNYKKNKEAKTYKAVAIRQEKDLKYGEKAKPKSGTLFEDGSYLNLSFLDSAVVQELGFEDYELIDNDPVVKSQRNKLLQTAASQKSSYDINGVAEPVADFAMELKDIINWDDYHRYAHSSTKYGYSVIQVLWETVDYEIIGEVIYPKTQRIYGFKHEDYRKFTFNTDKTKGAIGDVIYIPDQINITKKYPYNFIVIKNKPNFLYPEGRSDLIELKSIIDLKRFMIKTQARYAKKATIPSFVAIYKSDKEGTFLAEEASAMASSLSGIENGAGIAMPNVDNIISLMPVNQVDFIRVINYLDSVIQLKIIGTALLGGQTEKGGSYASAKVGEKELENAVKATALVLQNVDNIVIKYAIWQRFGSDSKLPKLLFDLTEKASLEDLKFMMEAKIPVAYDELLKVFPVAPGAIEPENKMWYLGSPDGSIENLMGFQDNKNAFQNEEELLKKDADRKQDEEDQKLKKLNEN